MSKNFPLITVAIPTYNRPDGLNRILQCITNQSYPNLEILISDNCSTIPEVKKILEEISVSDSRITACYQTSNIGIISNFQFLLDKSKGSFFTWVADDDLRDKDFVLTLYNLLLADKVALAAFSNFDAVNNNGQFENIYGDFMPSLNTITIKSKIKRLVSFYLLDEFSCKSHPIYSLFRKETLSSINIVELEKKYSIHFIDILFVVKVLEKGYFAVTDKKLITFTYGNKKNYLESGELNILNRVKNAFFYINYLINMTKEVSFPYSYLFICLLPVKLILVVKNKLFRFIGHKL
jgi:glycosyltransferase involved in cell wall biosynthesis